MLEDLYRLLRAGHVQAQGIVNTMTQPVVVLDQTMCVTTANHAFLEKFRVVSDDIVGATFFQLGNGQWDIPELRQLVSQVIPRAAAVIGFEVKHDFPTIGKRTFLIDARRLAHPDDNSMSILVSFDDVTEQQRHDAEKDFIISEMRHRMKNLFAIVRALASDTEAEGRTGVQYRDSFLARLEVTLRAQEIAATVISTDFETLLRQTIGEPTENRVSFQGPAIEIKASKVLSITMIFHELATNSAKHGALASRTGRVNINWSLERVPQGRTYLKCEWRETDGPTITPPIHRGYGRELIEGMSAHLGGTVQLNFGAEGFTAMFSLPI